MHMRRTPCEIWSYAATSQGTTNNWREAWDRSFLNAFRGNLALPAPDLRHPASRAVKQYISVVLSYPLCAPLLWQLQETNTYFVWVMIAGVTPLCTGWERNVRCWRVSM